jgi:hypothetical protein
MGEQSGLNPTALTAPSWTVAAAVWTEATMLFPGLVRTITAVPRGTPARVAGALSPLAGDATSATSVAEASAEPRAVDTDSR